MMAVGLNVVVGYAGLLDLGYVAFYAIGAYTAGWLASGQFSQVNFHFGAVGIQSDATGIHISVWLVLLIAGLVDRGRRHRHRPADASAPRRLPRDRDARLRRDHPAVRAERGQPARLRPDARHLRNQPDRPAGLRGTLHSAVGLPVRYDTSFPPLPDRLFFWTILGLLLLTLFCSMRLRDSRLGRAWIAIREDETAAGAMGIPLMRTKTWAYAIGAFFGGIAGAFIASFNSGAFPTQFDFNISVFLLCMVILGGMGSLWGVVVAGTILAWLNFEGLGNIGCWINANISRAATRSTCRSTRSGSTG